MKRLTLKEIREIGIPIQRSYIQFHQKPLSNKKLKKLLVGVSKSKEVKNG